MPTEPRFELDLMHPFTTAQARAAGIPAWRLRTGRFHKLAKGKYVSADRRRDAVLEAEAALLGHPREAFASHTTAAAVYRIPVPHDPVAHVSVFRPEHRRERSGVRSHVAAEETEVLLHRGIRVAAPAEVFLQLAGRLPLVELVVAGDFIARQGWCTPAQLVAKCLRSSAPHARRALAAARYVRDGVDSPMETRLRMLLVLAGLPEPAVNHVVRDELGRVVRRFDLCYPGVRVIVEYDGRQHAESPAQYDHDLYRREELDDQDWRIVVVTAKGVYVDPEETLRRVRKVLQARGMTGLPRAFRRDWRGHFPGRPLAS